MRFGPQSVRGRAQISTTAPGIYPWNTLLPGATAYDDFTVQGYSAYPITAWDDWTMPVHGHVPFDGRPGHHVTQWLNIPSTTISANSGDDWTSGLHVSLQLPSGIVASAGDDWTAGRHLTRNDLGTIYAISGDDWTGALHIKPISPITIIATAGSDWTQSLHVRHP